MNSSPRCTSCGTDLDTADRFCPSCGREVAAAVPPVTAKTCPHCGEHNPVVNRTCTACGAKIGESGTPASVSGGTTPRQTDGPSFFQSWKFTAGAAIILTIGLIIFIAARGEPEKVSVQPDPHDTEMIQDIRELQARVETDPADRTATLQLANRLYDVQFFDRAAVMYERYLKLDPQNLDARVDLGTSYFQISFSDTARHESYQTMAESAFLEAIRINPGHQLANFNLGIVNLHKGDMAAARGWFEKCIAIDPESESARRAKELLSQHIQNTPQ